MNAGPGLGFENDIAEIENRIAELGRQTDRSDEVENEIRSLRLELVKQLRETYSSLDAWQTVQVARHKNRPYTKDYLILPLMSSWNCMVTRPSVMIEQSLAGLQNWTGSKSW